MQGVEGQSDVKIKKEQFFGCNFAVFLICLCPTANAVWNNVRTGVFSDSIFLVDIMADMSF